MYPLILSLALLGAGNDGIDTEGLTPSQKAQLQLEAEKLKAQVPGETLRQTKEWVDVGTAIGQALGSSAKELNMAVNDFATTPVGKVTAVLIVWKVIGREIVHLILGPLFILCLLPAWWYFFRRAFVIKQILYGDGKEFKKKYVHYDASERKLMGDGHAFAKFVYGAMGPVIVIAGLLITLL